MSTMENFKVSNEMQQMIDYLLRDVIRRPEVRLEENTPLVSSGLIDSLALVDILFKLEEITKVRIPAGKVQAKDLDTVELMFSAVRRLGKS
jgi:acyl carrier protein